MKEKAIKILGLIATCGVLAGIFSGCAWSIGEKQQGPATQQPTKGQELIDLKKAKDQGAISEEEYNTKKNQILGQ